VAEFISSSSQVSISNAAFSKLSLFSILGLPISFYYGLVLVAAFAYMSSWTPLGRHMLFVGANREVARLAGIRVNRVRTGSYLVASVIAGIGASSSSRQPAGSTPAGRRATCCPPSPQSSSAPQSSNQASSTRSDPDRHLLPQTGIFGLELFGYSGWVQDVFYGAGLVVAVAVATIVRNRASTGMTTAARPPHRTREDPHQPVRSRNGVQP